MDNQLKQMGNRIREVRTILEIPVAEMAKLHGITEDEYLRHENGEVDSSFTFIYRSAERFGVDISSLITGESPRLSFYTLTRKGGGTPIKRRKGFEYLHQAAMLKNRHVEPFIVTAPFIDDQGPITLSMHAGQEFDYIISGKLKVQLGDKIELLGPGDSIYYDSGHPHGMVAAEGQPCVFLAVVIKGEHGEQEFLPSETPSIHPLPVTRDQLVYKKFLTEILDENGMLKDVNFHYPDNFNFAYDVIDAIAEKTPAKLAMRWISHDHQVRDFSFLDISEYSARVANYLTSLGIGKGDRVMLVLRRHYQFWFTIIALHRIGAIAIPASSQLTAKDFEYRYKSADVKAVICSADFQIAQFAEEAAANCPSIKQKILVNGKREGWLDFDHDIELFSDHFKRPAGQKVTDPILMYFSSGTTGYPKMVCHSGLYPLGHILTARWWHNIDPNGLHFTISDTGWGKAAWGKLYGQWFCEGAILTYDFDKFNSADILPLFKQNGVTTFCAPPTMYRFFIKEDLSKYDFSSLKYATTAGEALNAEVYQQFYQATGLKIMEGFGQTESTLLLGNLIGATPKPGSMGKPSPQFTIELLGHDDKPVKNGETGEICVKAQYGEQVPGLFEGYYKAEDKTREVWHDGYYHTGDTAWRDEDGYYWYVGRIDDVIKSSGYRIGPFEIESVLMELPYVLECAVTGAPDPIRGQVVKATIVLTKNTVGSDELKKEIQTYVKVHTAPYKYPRLIEFVTELPKTSSGKIRRVALREKDMAKRH